MTKKFTAYAPPMIWGVWTTIQSHGGSINFNIKYSVLGDTIVFGKVKYYKTPNLLTEQEFKDEVSITTANVWGNIEVCFKGVVLGSTVEGSIE